MSGVTELDARRLLCPMPVIRLQDCINGLESGDKVRITCTDPGTLNDIPTWCRINDHSLLECDQQDHQIVFLVQKSEHGN